MTADLHNSERVLALDLRPRSFGYVIFEGPQELLEWGVRSFRGGVNAVKIPARVKLMALLDEFAPEVVLLRAGVTGKGRKTSALVEMLRMEAPDRDFSLKFVPPGAVKQAFAGHERNKYEIASVLAAQFPELSWKLPHKRKPWESEDYRMSIFDAAALGITYFRSQATEEANRTLSREVA
jgi:hypothetical protein